MAVAYAVRPKDPILNVICLMTVDFLEYDIKVTRSLSGASGQLLGAVAGELMVP
ncbi:uncharacterized protein G2W53_027412 [Senna tora]|uniref:Uncharacterized protein n=1 Tax=Senna tora TaxID=362788 RepID=A0A834TIN3_9FABA|nr:uncharacterized protein G2W53_027412 [Senna tora]